MTTNLERAGLIARHVQLDSISLKSALLESEVDPLNPPDELELHQAHRARFELPREHPDHVYVYVDLHFSVATAEETQGPSPGSKTAELSATYLLVYALDKAAEQPEDALQHFAELNGAYNVWPYWRELVQTVVGRIGLAAIVIPVFRPKVRNVDEDSRQESLEFTE